MIEQKYIDLMNLELDKEISQDQKTALNSYLASSIEGREYFEKLSDITDYLVNNDNVIPSENLKKNILNSIDNSKYIKKSKSTFKIAAVSKFLSKYFVLSFGAGTAAILIAFLIFNKSEFLEVESDDVSGTIAPQSELLVEYSEEIKLNQDGVVGEVKKLIYNNNLNLVFSFQSESSSTINVMFNNKSLRFGDFIKNYPQNPSFSANDDQISVYASGKMNFMLTFDKIAELSSGNDISIKINGKNL